MKITYKLKYAVQEAQRNGVHGGNVKGTKRRNTNSADNGNTHKTYRLGSRTRQPIQPQIQPQIQP